ncbi:hypothetical protein [Methylobacterium radiodurans]|nr:hypothetical protein [Methylobacterium radiodurans]
MPVFDSKTLDADLEGQALLAAILQPTRAARSQALVNGRRRAKRGTMPAGSAGLTLRCEPAADTVASALSSTR